MNYGMCPFEMAQLAMPLHPKGSGPHVIGGYFAGCQQGSGAWCRPVPPRCHLKCKSQTLTSADLMPFLRGRNAENVHLLNLGKATGLSQQGEKQSRLCPQRRRWPLCPIEFSAERMSPLSYCALRLLPQFRNGALIHSVARSLSGDDRSPVPLDRERTTA